MTIAAKKEINLFVRPGGLYRTRLSLSRRIWMATQMAYEAFKAKATKEELDKEDSVWKALLLHHRVKPRHGPGHSTVDSACRQDRSIYTPHQGAKECAKRRRRVAHA